MSNPLLKSLRWVRIATILAIVASALVCVDIALAIMRLLRT